MKIAPQGWVILKCKQVGDFEVQIDTNLRILDRFHLILNPAVKLTTKSEKSQSQKIRLKGTPTNWVKGFFLVKVNSILSVFVTLSLCV